MGGEKELISVWIACNIGLEPWGAAAIAGAKRVLDLQRTTGAPTCWVLGFGELGCEDDDGEKEEEDEGRKAFH